MGMVFIRVGFTLKNYPEKSGFYYRLYTVYSLWFYALPIMVFFTSVAVPKYMRAKVVNGWNRLIDFLAYSFFLMLMRPSVANKNFPFHIRTSQISCASQDGDHNFPHNVYQANNNSDNNRNVQYDVFTVQAHVQARRREEPS